MAGDFFMRDALWFFLDFAAFYFKHVAAFLFKHVASLAGWASRATNRADGPGQGTPTPAHGLRTTTKNQEPKP
jgi:hypothetical protein